MNCTLYGSVARIPYFGITITEYAEKERDIFLIMYIAGGSLLPHNQKIKDISMSLTRRTHTKAFTALQQNGPIGPYVTGKTFDLVAVFIRLLYWASPIALSLLFFILLLPRPRSEEE